MMTEAKLIKLSQTKWRVAFKKQFFYITDHNCVYKNRRVYAGAWAGAGHPYIHIYELCSGPIISGLGFRIHCRQMHFPPPYLDISHDCGVFYDTGQIAHINPDLYIRCFSAQPLVFTRVSRTFVGLLNLWWPFGASVATATVTIVIKKKILVYMTLIASKSDGCTRCATSEFHLWSGG